MNQFKEIKEIAKCISKINKLMEKLSEKMDCEGIDPTSAQLVSLSKDDIQNFRKSNGETEDYFVDQWTGYCEDDYYGFLYFKTDVPGQYVKIYFEM